MLDKLLSPRVEGTIPYKLEIHKSQLLELVNAQLHNQQEPGQPLTQVPNTCEVSVNVPGGGDWSSTDLELDDKDVKITIRWRQPL